MRLAAEATLPFARDVVFRAYRDHLVELVPFLPNVRGIEVTSRADEGTVTRLVNVWRGGGEIPAVARAVLSDKMLSWTDHATWDAARWECAWRMEAHSFRDAVHAAGTNRFEEPAPGRTRLVIEGALTIDARRLPIPRLLAGTVGPAIERFLVGMIRPNLTEVARGVEKYLAASAPSPPSPPSSG